MGEGMERLCSPRGPVMDIALEEEAMEEFVSGTESGGRERVTFVGMVRGAEPIWDWREEEEENNRLEGPARGRARRSAAAGSRTFILMRAVRSGA